MDTETSPMNRMLVAELNKKKSLKFVYLVSLSPCETIISFKLGTAI